jgi:hypothetical protein
MRNFDTVLFETITDFFHMGMWAFTYAIIATVIVGGVYEWGLLAGWWRPKQ